MNSDKKNNQVNKNENILNEPEIKYGAEDNLVSNNSEKADLVLEKLISKSVQDATVGKGISHEEMLRKIKTKYPFLK